MRDTSSNDTSSTATLRRKFLSNYQFVEKYMFEALHVVVDYKKINVVCLFLAEKGLYYFDGQVLYTCSTFLI